MGIKAAGADNPVTTGLAQQLFRGRINTFHHGVDLLAASFNGQGDGHIQVVRGRVSGVAGQNNRMQGLINGCPLQGFITGRIAAHVMNAPFLQLNRQLFQLCIHQNNRHAGPDRLVQCQFK